MKNNNLNGVSNNDTQNIKVEEKRLSTLIDETKGYLHCASLDLDNLEVNEYYYRNLIDFKETFMSLDFSKENETFLKLKDEFINHLEETINKWFDLVIDRYGHHSYMFNDDSLSVDTKRDVYNYAYDSFDATIDGVGTPQFEFVITSDTHILHFEDAWDHHFRTYKSINEPKDFDDRLEEAKASLNDKLNDLEESYDTREEKDKEFFLDLTPLEKLVMLTKKQWIELIKANPNDFNKTYVVQDSAVKRIIGILSGPKKENNCMVLGASGSGKTSVVNYVINLVSQGKCKELKDKVFYKLNASNIEQKHIGETGINMMKLFKTFEENPNCILVIDEFAEFANNGGYQYDQTNNLGSKILPALSEGKVQVIGMETTSRYNQFMFGEKALCRRFKEVTLVEMKDEEAKNLAKSLLTEFETKDGNGIKFIDKDLLVERLSGYTKKFYPGKANPAAIKSLINDLFANIKSFTQPKYNIFNVDSLNNFIKDKFNCNVTNETLKNLSKELKSMIIGQDTAIDQLTTDLTEYKYDFESSIRPLSLFFVGPTGVGKTESAKQLAKICFKNENSMLKVNMADYAVPFSGATLFNYSSPLAKFITAHPCGVIVFDEIEKADPDVMKTLLVALDEGIADDGRGNTLSFRGSVIIFTSNLGCNDSNKNIGSLVMSTAINDETAAANIKEALKSYFKPEFIGRIDHFIVFKALSKENVLDILKLRLKELQASNSNYASLKVSEDELKALVDKSNVKEVGARCIPNVLKKYLLSKLTKSFDGLKEDR
ncbi:MAG: AAA family ATPase [Bacilli bacterium]|nr:AAA family ATPase [Bacilli bacterium]